MPDPDLFAYDVSPLSVRCSQNVKQPNVVEIRLMATNRTGHAVTCPQITIEIPSANNPESPTRLTADPVKIVAVPGPRSPWTVFPGGNGVWFAVPVPPATGLAAGETLTVVCSDIVVNVLPGDVELKFGQVVVEGEHEKTVPASALLKKVKPQAGPPLDATPVRVAGPGDAALEAPGAAARLIGYGETTTGLPQSLQQGTVSVIGAGDCQKAYPHAISATMLCTEDVAHHDPLIQACAGDSGGPTIADTPAGPVQIGVTSWGPEVKNNACGDAFLPNVPMRLSSFRAFIDQPDPVIEPFTRGKGGAGVPHLEGTGRIGSTVTCTPPKLSGAAATLSYTWQLAQGVKFETVKGAHAKTLTITRALYDHAKTPRPLFCEVVARNAGGSLDVLSGSLRLKK